MKKKIRDIYYSDELPELKRDRWISWCWIREDSGLCKILQNSDGIYNQEFERYVEDYFKLDPDADAYISTPGEWSEERLNLICLLIHSLELED